MAARPGHLLGDLAADGPGVVVLVSSLWKRLDLLSVALPKIKALGPIRPFSVFSFLVQHYLIKGKLISTSR